MPNRFYTTVFFRLNLVFYAALYAVAFIYWYNTAAAPPANSWVPLAAYIALAHILVFFPSTTMRLPRVLIPIIQLNIFMVLQSMLTMMPQTSTVSSLVPLILLTVFICVALIQRSHGIAAWFLFSVAMLQVFFWNIAMLPHRYSVAAEFLIPAAVLVASHIFKHQIGLATHKARQSRILLRNAEIGQEQERGVSDIASRRVAEVRELTEEMLHRIAYNPEPVTRDEIDDFRFTEAQLRDSIRGQHIVNPEILEATLTARRRGARVDILDERGEELPAAVVQVLTDCAVDLLDNATGGTITIRAFPADDPIAVMMVHDGNSDEDEPSAIEISPTGEVERF